MTHSRFIARLVLPVGALALFLLNSGCSKAKPKLEVKGAERNVGASVSKLEVFTGAKEFCDGRVYLDADSGHLSWIVYGTEEPKAKLVAYYTEKYGVAAETGDKRASWSFTGEKEKSLLVVLPADAAAPWQQECEVPAGTKTVIEVSSLPLSTKPALGK